MSQLKALEELRQVVAAARLSIPTKVGDASCSVYATTEMLCPLCRVTIPANTHHECERKVPA